MEFRVLKEHFEVLDHITSRLSSIEDLSQFCDGKKIIIQDFIQKLSNPEFHIVFIGTYSAGKSTIINALLGRKILPEANKAYTKKVTLIRKSQDGKEGFFCYKNGVRLPREFQPINNLIKFVTGDSQYSLEYLKGFDTVEVFLNGLSFDSDIVLVDTPGTGSADVNDKLISDDYVIKKAKVCVVCFMQSQIYAQSQADSISLIKTLKSIPNEILFWVLNRWDEAKSDDDKKQALEEFDKLTNENNIIANPSHLFTISAKSYLDSLDSKGLDKTYIENFELFKNTLFNFLQNSAKKEYYQNALNELKRHTDEITNKLDSLYKKRRFDEKGRERMKIEYRNKEADRIREDLLATIKATYQESAERIKKFWTENEKKEAIDYITTQVKKRVIEINIIPQERGATLTNHYNLPKRIVDTDWLEILREAIEVPILRELRAYYKPMIEKSAHYFKTYFYEGAIEAFWDITQEKLLVQMLKGFILSLSANHEDKIHEITGYKKKADVVDKTNRFIINDAENKTEYDEMISNYLSGYLSENSVEVGIKQMMHKYMRELTEQCCDLAIENKNDIILHIMEDNIFINEELRKKEAEAEIVNENMKNLELLNSIIVGTFYA